MVKSGSIWEFAELLLLWIEEELFLFTCCSSWKAISVCLKPFFFKYATTAFSISSSSMARNGKILRIGKKKKKTPGVYRTENFDLGFLEGLNTTSSSLCLWKVFCFIFFWLGSNFSLNHKICPLNGPICLVKNKFFKDIIYYFVRNLFIFGSKNQRLSQQTRVKRCKLFYANVNRWDNSI